MSRQVVLKYMLPSVIDEITVQEGARFIHVHQQNDVPTVWAIVDPDAPKTEKHRFTVVGTGFVIGVDPSGPEYLGTTHIEGGRLVLHVFHEVVR